MNHAQILLVFNHYPDQINWSLKAVLKFKYLRTCSSHLVRLSLERVSGNSLDGQWDYFYDRVYIDGFTWMLYYLDIEN
jgi:hypothetical protein